MFQTCSGAEQTRLQFGLGSDILTRTSVRELFREIFANFSRIFRGFREFFEVFGLARTCSDLFGSIRMHSDAPGCVRMRSDAFGHFRKISKIFDEKIGFDSASALRCLCQPPWRSSGGHVRVMYGSCTGG